MDLTGLFAEFPGLDPSLFRPQVELGSVPVDEFAQMRSGRARSRKSNFLLPAARQNNGTLEYPEQERAGAITEQLEKAKIMYELGLVGKARRQASCAVYARIQSCENGHLMYQRYFCKNRYCFNPACGRRFFSELFNKYIRLDEVTSDMVPEWENRPKRKPRPGDLVVAKIDITIINTGQMPTKAEVRRVNRDVRRLFRAAERAFKLTYPPRLRVNGRLLASRPAKPGDYGVLWTDEFGGKSRRPGKIGNTNLHVHAIYCGPFISQEWLPKKWAEIRGDGSKIVSIKSARTFRAGLYHALKYAGKFLTFDPARLAELEFAFDRVRRVHTMGGFYNAIPKNVQPKKPLRCPVCDGKMFEPTGPLCPVLHFESEGLRDFDLVRHEAAREKVFRRCAPTTLSQRASSPQRYFRPTTVH